MLSLRPNCECATPIFRHSRSSRLFAPLSALFAVAVRPQSSRAFAQTVAVSWLSDRVGRPKNWPSFLHQRSGCTSQRGV